MTNKLLHTLANLDDPATSAVSDIFSFDLDVLTCLIKSEDRTSNQEMIIYDLE